MTTPPHPATLPPNLGTARLNGRSADDISANGASVIASVAGVAEVTHLRGPDAADSHAPALLVEVPHGADRFAHYQALRRRLRGRLPAALEHFFFANTDVGAWQYGVEVARRVVAARPDRSAVVIRCLIPRTFIDTNRVAQPDPAQPPRSLAAGGLTAGLAPYILDPNDQQLLLNMHRRYVQLVTAAFTRICGGGGFGLIPHTYGPRTMGIEQVDEHIVEALHAAAQPDVWESWPLRPEIDLLTRDQDGNEHAPAGIVRALTDAYSRAGLTACESQTYCLHPATQAFRWAMDYSDRVLCMEVRRDLLVASFDLFAQMDVQPAAIDRVSAPLADWIDAWLSDRDR